ncbi:ABC transporter ATP-binding protein [Paraphotobacterium marinum]|uniref:ABC transporter ATP-binding protein n=1 Tax=Paraphotobacterium marinum TaxID=1755811 RepID=A0A220VCP7_9GAMM|nr:ABC transporter ATP-binding protein [Paraphotobacterium marinum]ASK78117.1 ABC transporter ATP-binding protein [Paraphotobacterium marinum]
MNKFKYYFTNILDQEDKKKFLKYILVLFLGSAFSVLGIGVVIPFINLLIQPEKIMSFSLAKGWSYHELMVFFTVLLVMAFFIKNTVALMLINYQYKFLFSLTAKIQKKLFSGYITAPYEYHLNRNTPNLIKIVNNETTLFSNYIVAPLGTVFTETFSSMFVIIVLFYLNPVFTSLVALFLGLGVYLFMRAIKKKIEFYSLRRSKSWTSMTQNVLDGLTGIKETKLYHNEEKFLTNFSKEANSINTSSSFQLTFQSAPRMLIEFIGLTVVMCVLCGFVLYGESSQNMFLLLGVFGVAAAQLLPSLNRLTQALVQIKYGMPALVSIYEELNKIEIPNKDYFSNKSKSERTNFKHSINLKDLYFNFSDGTKAIDGVNVEIYKNQKIAFVGESGAGKTTLVDVILGMYEPSSGKIYLDGEYIDSESKKTRYQKLFAYIPQSIILYDKSIRENVAFGIDEDLIDDELVKDCLKSAQLLDFVGSLDKREFSVIGESGTRLSGGQRQRLGIARALYKRPKILVMDEATSALDNKTEKDITSVISKLKDLTIITIAHRLSTIKDYDVIHVMQSGKLISSGTYNELLEKCEVFSNIAVHHNIKES